MPDLEVQTIVSPGQCAAAAAFEEKRCEAPSPVVAPIPSLLDEAVVAGAEVAAGVGVDEAVCALAAKPEVTVHASANDGSINHFR